MSLVYKLLYRFGVTPWEEMEDSGMARQAIEFFEQEEVGREPPFGNALDLGCGTGIWTIKLAQRGWDATGVDIVRKALQAAEARANKEGVNVKFVNTGVTQLKDAGIGTGYRLLIDFGCLHGLGNDELAKVGTEVDAVASEDAALLILAWKPAFRLPVLPRGVSREQIESAFPNWRVDEDFLADTTDLPGMAVRAEPRWLRLKRT